MKLRWVGMLVVLVVVAWIGPGSARGIEPLVHDLRTGMKRPECGPSLP
jgi:hypothetical protein